MSCNDERIPQTSNHTERFDTLTRTELLAAREMDQAPAPAATNGAVSTNGAVATNGSTAQATGRVCVVCGEDIPPGRIATTPTCSPACRGVHRKAAKAEYRRRAATPKASAGSSAPAAETKAPPPTGAPPSTPPPAPAFDVLRVLIDHGARVTVTLPGDDGAWHLTREAP